MYRKIRAKGQTIFILTYCGMSQYQANAQFDGSLFSGLDPAQPNYQNFDIQVRLDQDDADFVDAIHTDGSDYDTISGNIIISEQSKYLNTKRKSVF